MNIVIFILFSDDLCFIKNYPDSVCTRRTEVKAVFGNCYFCSGSESKVLCLLEIPHE